jgi:uncharacterized membrane protein
VSDSFDPLELTATTRRVRAVARAASLPEAALERGLVLATETPERGEWREFLSRTLMILGAALILAGVVCFTAYNWDQIGKFGKFAGLELAIVAATLGAWRNLPRLSGEIALFAAVVLVGPLLALFGQTYQTGADPYGLFLTWVLVSIPWVLAARFAATWMLALALLELSIALYAMQVIAPRETDALYVPLILGTITLAALALWEWQRRRPAPWIAERWPQRALALGGSYAIWVVASAFVVLGNKASGPGLLGIAALAAIVAIGIRYYWRVRRDRFMATVGVSAAMAWGTVVVGRVVFDTLRMYALGLLVMSALVIWEITLGLKWYRSMNDAT